MTWRRAKSHFSLQGVENSLRAHWTDSQVRRRDGADDRPQAHFEDQDWDEYDEPVEWDQSYFENWDPSDIVLFQEAQAAEQEAWAQIQEGRRTLREAREKQKAVRLGRQYFNSKGKGRGKSQRYRPREADDMPPRGPCLRCGKGHATRDCPHKPPGESKRVFKQKHTPSSSALRST